MTTSRVQLALNVTDLEEATRFYRDFFGVEPAKRRAGYTNFAIADPPLKLVLFENPTASSTPSRPATTPPAGCCTSDPAAPAIACCATA